MKRMTVLCLSLVGSLWLVACSETKTDLVIVPANDTTAPLVLSTTPASGAIDVALGSTVSAAFSEAMNPATLTAATFTVDGVPGTVSVSADNRTITFTPGAPLTAGTAYIVTLTTGVQDAVGNALANDVTWRFTTATAPDTTAPKVNTVTPAPGSEGNPATSTITVKFSETIDCTSITRGSVKLLEGASEVQVLLACSGDTLTVTPSYGMPTRTVVTALVGPSVRDRAGNPLGYTHRWSFGIAPWSDQFGTAGKDHAYALTSDTAGNVYAAGYTEGSLDGEPNSGSVGVFVTKYDRNAKKQWTRLLAGAEALAHLMPSLEWLGRAPLTSDAAGNIYVAGSTSIALDGQSNAGGRDAFVSKYDGDGTKQWTRLVGTAATETGLAVTLDAAGNVYVAGCTTGAFEGQTNMVWGYEDIFVTKYDADGDKQWTRQFGTDQQEEPEAVTSDAAGNVYVAGHTFGAFEGYTSSGSLDYFVTKYDANGNKQWIRQVGPAWAFGLTSDAAGNIYVGGSTSVALDGQTFTGGAYDAFVTKYDTHGNKQWTRLLGTTDFDYGQALVSDAGGNIYMAGITFTSTTTGGGADLFVAKFDANGNKQWVRQLGTGPSEWDEAHAVTLDVGGDIYVAGYTAGTLDGETSAGGEDAFIVKYQADGRER